MLKTTLASLRAHSARLIFSSLAIILGVGFAAGTIVLTDTIQRGYESSFAADARRLDVVATRADSATSSTPADLAASARAAGGVDVAELRYTGVGRLLDAKGSPAGGQGYATVDTVPAAKSLRWQQLSRGRLPNAAGEITLDKVSAKRFGFQVGDTVQLLDGDDQVHKYDLVGLVDMADSPQYSGTPYAGVTAATAKQLVGGTATQRLDVVADRGADQVTVKQNVAAVLPKGWTAYTSEQYTEHQLKEISGELTQVRIGLLAFAAIAMFVAAIVIANTFTILIAQRTREMALLRCVGATRAQVYRSVLFESLVLGVVASALGLLAGVGLAAGAQAVLRNVLDAPLPDGFVAPTVVGLVVPFVLGTVVTVVAAVFPAVGATRIAPVAALRNQPGADRTRKRHVVRTILALLAVVAGCAAMAPGVLGDGGQGPFLLALGGGALTFLGVLFLTPVIVPRLIGLVGWVFATPFRTPGKLARANAVRNPGRAAATSAALLVGVTLISIMTVVSASVQKTATAGLDEEFPYDLTIAARGTPVPQSVLTKLRDEHKLSAVVPLYTAKGKLGDEALPVQGIDAAGAQRKLGDLKAYAKVADGKVVVPKYVAVRDKLSVGDQVTLHFAGGRTLTGEVAGTISGDDAVVTEHDLRAAAPSAVVGTVFLKGRSGVSAEDVQSAVDDALAGHADLSVDGPLQYRASIEQGIQTTLLLFAGLVGVAVLIALFGIANTLALSVLERTRESGVLRALGLTRRQLRGMFSGEAALMAAVAGVLGAVLGVGFGYVAIASLVGHSDAEFVVPFGRLAAFVGVAAVAGLIASVLPARKAARSSVVAAMAED